MVYTLWEADIGNGKETNHSTKIMNYSQWLNLDSIFRQVKALCLYFIYMI